MKRYLLKILLSVTAILFVVLVSTAVSFAQESDIGTNGKIQSLYTINNDKVEYETIKDEHGYKAVLKNPEQENSQLLSANRYQASGGSVIGRADPDNFIRLKIPEKATDIKGNVKLTYKYFYSGIDYKYTTYDEFVEYREMDEAQTKTTITLAEFNWSISDSYIITVDTVHGIYKTEITQADLTSAITLSMDSTYTSAVLSVPFDLSTYKNYGLNFLVYDDLGIYITNYFMDKNDIARGYKIPSGHYRIQAIGEGSENAFSLLKNDYNLTPSTKTIAFSGNDMTKVSLSMSEGNSTGKQVTVSNTVFLHENFNTLYYVAPSFSNNIPYVYITKYNYKSVTISTVVDGTNWRYDFTENGVDASAGPVTVKYDLGLKTKFIKFTDKFYGGNFLYGLFNIINNNGQTVDIDNNSGQIGQPNNKVIKLTIGGESYTFYNTSNFIILPNPSVSGTFTVDFSALGPLAVIPLKDSIYINRSDALADDSELDYDVPDSVNEGQKDYIYIRAKNTGTNVWNTAGGYKLVAVGGSDPLTSKLSYPIPEGVSIKENMEYVFEIPITAPTRGIYTTDWQMVKGTTAFGNITAPELNVRSMSNPYLIRPISINSLEPDKASPQMKGTTIRWTCKIKGGNDPVFYYKIFQGSTLVKSSTAYSSTNYFDWTPVSEATNYRVLVYVKENGNPSSTAVTKLSDYYSIDDSSISRYMGRDITDWVIDDQNGYIYAVSSTYLLFIRLSDLYIEKTITFDYSLSDIDFENGKLYVSIPVDNQINVVDIATKAIEKTITTQYKPYRIAVDGNKLFYATEDQWYDLCVYDMESKQEYSITSVSDDCELDITVDRTNHILYAGESGISGGSVTAISTYDYSYIGQSTYDEKYGFQWPERQIVYDDGDVFYAGFNLDAGNLAAINGCYNDTIIYAKGNYAFSKNSVYDRDRYVKIKDLPSSSSYILMDTAGFTYFFDSNTKMLYKQRISYKLDTSIKHTNTLNNVALDEQLTSWVSSEDGNYIYAVSESGNKLLFLRTSDLTVEKELYIGSMPSDIELANGYLYISLSGSTKIIVIDPTTYKVTKRILVEQCPYRIAVDGNKLFYTTLDQWCDLLAYDMVSGKEERIFAHSYGGFYEPDLAVDRINHILYCGESLIGGSKLYSFSTADYVVMSESNDFPGPPRNVVYDAGSVYYAGRRFKSDDLTSILGNYGEHIIYAKDTYVFSGNHMFDRDSCKSVVTFDKTADLAEMLNDGSYLLYNDQARSISKKGPLPLPIKILSFTSDKTSPQLTGTTIRWTCNATGGTNPVYYFKIFKGSTLAKSSTVYTSTNYFDWTPTEAGTDYRVMVYVKENGASSTTAVTKFSNYFTVTMPAPVEITSVVPDKTSPQLTGTTIRWTCNITGGSKPVYYFKVFDGSTLVQSTSAYSSTNYIDWTPMEAGTDYRAMVYVKENGASSSTAVTKFSSYFTAAVPAPIAITSVVPDKASPQLTGTTIRWTCNITGGSNPVYSFKVFSGSTLIQSSPAFSTTNYIDWTPTEAGDKYRVMVYVKENGASSTTAVTKMSGYYTITAASVPIAIDSLEPDKTSPQAAGTAIRWTCNITGGSSPVYSFKVFNGSMLVQSSPAFSETNYIDWTPGAAGSKYRVMVYVKENGASSTTAVTRMSGYYTVTEAAAPIAITSLVPDKTSPQAAGTTIRWTCNITGGSNPVYSFKVFNGSTLVQSSPAFSATNYIDWTPGATGSKYRVMVYVKENGASSTIAVTKMSGYYTID